MTFGTIHDSECRIWQQRKVLALTELVQLGVTKRLPLLDWSVPYAGYLVGRVPRFAGQSGRQHPRDMFDAWFDALAMHRRTRARPLDIRQDGAHRDERTTRNGETRLITAYNFRLSDGEHPSAPVVIVAEWFEAELDESRPAATP